MKKVLIVSHRNEARSQMAEKWLKYYGKKHLKVWSAGVEKGTVNVMAQKAMSEAVMDIPDYKSKCISDLDECSFDFILYFDHDLESLCNGFKGEPELFYFEVPDPAKAEGDEKNCLQAYHAVCNAVEDICFGFVQERFRIV